MPLQVMTNVGLLQSRRCRQGGACFKWECQVFWSQACGLRFQNQFPTLVKLEINESSQ